MKFKHYKGGIYTFITEATDTDIPDSFHSCRVIYSDESGRVWSRNKFEFYGYVKDPETGKSTSRFKEIRCIVCGEWLDECRAGHSQEIHK